MIKYVATAAILKAFSLNKFTRKLYRNFGNAVGARDRERSIMPDYYRERVQRMLDLSSRYGLIRDGSRILELGTGWMHWEALTTRLFHEIDADLYDVWDNRQLEALKSYLMQLRRGFSSLAEVTPQKIARADALVDELLVLSDFEQIYKKLGFRYILDPVGELAGLNDGAYDLIVSAGVYEHLPREGVQNYLHQNFRVLKPGGYAIHSINTADHLHLYDRKTSAKNYLRFSARTWRLLFENDLQYINRLQRCEWMAMFENAGFILLEEYSSRCSLRNFPLHVEFRSIDPVSLETTSWYAVYQKPGGDVAEAGTVERAQA